MVRAFLGGSMGSPRKILKTNPALWGEILCMKRVRNFVPFIILAYKYCQKKYEARWLRWPKTSIILSMSFSRVLLVYARSMQRRKMLLRRS